MRIRAVWRCTLVKQQFQKQRLQMPTIVIATPKADQLKPDELFSPTKVSVPLLVGEAMLIGFICCPKFQRELGELLPCSTWP